MGGIGTGTQFERSEYQQVKADLHRKILDRLNLEKLGRAPSDAAREEVLVLIRNSVNGEAVPLSFAERERLAREILDEIFGLGPLEPLLKDPSISDILVNRYNQVYIERNGKLEPTGLTFKDDQHLMQIIDRIVSRVGRRVDESSPMVDARLPDGSRVNAIIPPLAVDGPALSIRRFGRDPLTARNLIENKSLTEPMLELLAAMVKGRLNLLISGGTGAGKTTLLNVLSGYIPNVERIVTIEDAAELQLKQEHVVRLETRPPNIEGKGAIRQRQLVINSLRMRPDRIVVGEVRGEEAFDMLQAMNTGHEGSLTTVHANSPRDHGQSQHSGARGAAADCLRHPRGGADCSHVRRHPQGDRGVRDHGHGKRSHLHAGHLCVRAQGAGRRGQGPGGVQVHRHPRQIYRPAGGGGLPCAPSGVRICGRSLKRAGVEP
jgi:pilus assembly protein CpaF